MYYLLREWRMENYVSIRLFYFLIENSILAPCTIFIGSNFYGMHKLFLKYHQMVETHRWGSYNALINKRNQKGFFVEKVGGVIFECSRVERFLYEYALIHQIL